MKSLRARIDLVLDRHHHWSLAMLDWKCRHWFGKNAGRREIDVFFRGVRMKPASGTARQPSARRQRRSLHLQLHCHLPHQAALSEAHPSSSSCRRHSRARSPVRQRQFALNGQGIDDGNPCRAGDHHQRHGDPGLGATPPHNATAWTTDPSAQQSVSPRSRGSQSAASTAPSPNDARQGGIGPRTATVHVFAHQRNRASNTVACRKNTATRSNTARSGSIAPRMEADAHRPKKRSPGSTLTFCSARQRTTTQPAITDRQALSRKTYGCQGSR